MSVYVYKFVKISTPLTCWFCMFCSDVQDIIYLGMGSTFDCYCCVIFNNRIFMCYCKHHGIKSEGHLWKYLFWTVDAWHFVLCIAVSFWASYFINIVLLWETAATMPFTARQIWSRSVNWILFSVFILSFDVKS